MFDRPKPTVGCSANGRRRRRLPSLCEEIAFGGMCSTRRVECEMRAEFYLENQDVADCRVQWRACVSFGINFRVPYKTGYCFTCRMTVSYPRKALLHGLSYLYSVCSGIGSLLYPKTVGCHFLPVRGLKTLEFPCKYIRSSASLPDSTTESSRRWSFLANVSGHLLALLTLLLSHQDAGVSLQIYQVIC